MIVSLNSNSPNQVFETLLSESVSTLQAQSQHKKEYFLSRQGDKLETDVYEVMNIKAKHTPFEGTIELISGQRFPDIVAYLEEKRGFGVEVKTTTKNHWKTTGGSIFEGTRVENVERIYLLFGKLVNPIEFRYRRYEECLYDVAVTHSPRYLIDMDTPLNETIFDRVKVPYDDLRQLDNPFQPIKTYFRGQLSGKGEDIWWIDQNDETAIGNIAVRHWGNLSSNEKENLRNQAMALFPEIFGKGSKKYAKLAAWLAARHGIVSPSLRDTFTAGGQVELEVCGNTYRNVPRIFFHLQKNLLEIVNYVNQLNIEDLSYYWETKVSPTQRVKQWINQVSSYSQETLGKNNLDIKEMVQKIIGS
ncbi:hypothetical protein WDW89_25335 [Deltaproteobacteria bacterium TL4]